MPKLLSQIGPARLTRYFLFSIWQIIFDLLTFSPFRVLWLKIFGAQIGTNTVIDKIDFINLDRTGLKGLIIGNHCFLGRGSLIDLAGSVTLKDWVILSPRIIILSHMSVGFTQHPLSKTYPPKIGSTVLKKGSFIGAGAIILSSVVVGPKSVVAAGAVVTKNIPPNTTSAGIPAKVIKSHA